MKNILLAILVCTCVLLFSCNNTEKKNIIVEGRVFNKTGEPIENAQVIVLGWKDAGFDDIDYIKEEILTDKNGFFKTAFKKAIKIDIASQAPGFAPTRKKIDDIGGNSLKVELRLGDLESNASVTSNLIDTTVDLTPYIGYRKYMGTKGSVECLGMDFTSGRVSNEASKIDIWPLPNQGFVNPNVFTTKENGGIIPIFANQISQSLIYEHSTAPSKGYEQTYKLKGNEAGLLIKLPNEGYAKLIFKSEKIHKSMPNNGNQYEDLGISFDWIYNPTGNNLKISPKINLEDYILQNM
jgi:hypothetical protein